MEHLFGLAMALLDPTHIYEFFIITAIPAGITLLFAPLLNDNVPRVVLVGKPALASAKRTVSCAMLAAQAVSLAAHLAACCSREPVWPLQTMLAAVLSFLASLAVVGFLQSSRRYAFPSTTFHALFLAATLLYDLAVVRRDKKRLGGIGIMPLLIVTLKSLYVLMSLAVRNPVLVLQPGLPRELEGDDAPSLPSIWSCLSWPGLVSIPNLRENAILTDLPEPSWKLCSETVFRQFRERWDKVDKNSDQALAKAITSTLGEMLLSIVPLRLFHVVLVLAQPLLLWRVLTTAFQDNITSGTMVANLTAAALLWVGIPIVKLIYTKQSDYIVVSTRAILIAAIYDKMMRLSAMNIQRSNVVSQLMEGMRSIELLINSTQGVASAIIQVWLGLCLLWPFIGNASILIFAPTTLVALGSWVSVKQELHHRNRATARRKTRVALTSSILKQLQSIKMMGLGPALAMCLNNQRKSEVNALLEERDFRMREFSLLAFNHSMTPVLIIAGYLYLTQPSHSFGAAETFTCFMLIRIISDAFNVAVDRLSCAQRGSQIIAQIQKFLLLEEVFDTRLLAAAEDDDNDGPNSLGATPAINLVRGTVMSKEGEVILLEATLRAFRYGLTVVFGPVACGKSTVLRLILGEVAPSSGRITVPDGPMVYCDQDVWLPFVCIRHIIVGATGYDAEWYTHLVRACGLEDELARLPDGDGTVIGSRECVLSVGLKQKIAMARAVYDCPTTIILDDPLHAVDYTTASRIYERLFGPRGLVFHWECTVVLATNDIGHLQLADALFTVGYDGRITSQNVTTYTSAANTRAVLRDSNGLFRSKSSTEEAPEPVPQTLPEGHDEESRFHRRSQDASLYSYFQQPAGRSLMWTWAAAVTVAAVTQKMPEIFWGFSLSTRVLTPAC